MPEFFDREWQDLVLAPPAGFVKVITVGSGDARTTKTGFWTAELIWVDENGDLQYIPLGAKTRGVSHVALDLKAALSGIREAAELKLPIQIHSTVQSNVDTPTKFWSVWKANEEAGRGFRNNHKQAPQNLALWQEIMALAEGLNVTWHKRPQGERDGLLQFEEMSEFQRHMANQAEGARRAKRGD